MAPPVDIAWLWHVHRLSPLGYRADCVRLLGQPLHAAAGTNPFAFTADTAGTSLTRMAWEALYPDETFENRLLSGSVVTTPLTVDAVPAADEATLHGLHVDIISSVQRQSGFLWQARKTSCPCPAARSRPAN